MARLTPQLLPQWLKKSLPTCILLYGNEDYLIEESALAIRKQIQVLGDVERIELDLPIENLAMHLQPTLFAQTRLFEVKLTKLNQTSQDNLMHLSQCNQPHTFIVIKANQVRINPKAPWVENLDKQGWIIAHYPLNAKQFETWLQQKALQMNLQLDVKTWTAILATCEGNYLAASSQLEALQLAPDTVHQQQSQYALFSLTEAALAKETARVLKIFAQIKKTQQLELQLMLWAIAQTLRALIKLTLHPQQAKQILFNEKIPVNIQGLVIARSKSKNSNWRHLIIQLAAADKLLKMGAADEAWDAILDIHLNLSNFALPHKEFA